VKEYAPGSFVAVGLSGDTANAQQSLLLKFDNTGKITLNIMISGIVHLCGIVHG
jgi:hypothetical protein